jgi:hypothetical protein
MRVACSGGISLRGSRSPQHFRRPVCRVIAGLRFLLNGRPLDMPAPAELVGFIDAERKSPTIAKRRF